MLKIHFVDLNFGPDATVPSSMKTDCFSVTETDLQDLGLQLVPSGSDHWSSNSSQQEVSKYEISSHEQYISLEELASFDVSWMILSIRLHYFQLGKSIPQLQMV